MYSFQYVQISQNCQPYISVTNLCTKIELKSVKQTWSDFNNLHEQRLCYKPVGAIFNVRFYQNINDPGSKICALFHVWSTWVEYCSLENSQLPPSNTTAFSNFTFNLKALLVATSCDKCLK